LPAKGLPGWPSAAEQSALRGPNVSPENWGADFALTVASAQVRSQSDLPDEVAVLSFGYTHCPDV